MYAEFHRAKAPLIIIEFTGEKANAQNFDVYLKGLEENYAAKEKIALVFDTRRALDLNPRYQLKQAQWLRQNKKLIEDYCQGVAYVVPNSLMRNMLGLIFKVQPSPVSFQVFETFTAALVWADAQLKHL
jgi:sugar/nucleoside kinase (ribokinase family)